VPRSKLDKEVQKTIVDALLAGNHFNVACQLAGVAESTGLEWLARGKGQSKRAAEPLYVEFAEAVEQAKAQSEVRAVLRIRQAAQGGAVIKSVTITKVDPKTGATTEVHEVKQYAPPNWTADAWWLERKFNDRWGRKDRHSHTVDGLQKGEITLSWGDEGGSDEDNPAAPTP